MLYIILGVLVAILIFHSIVTPKKPRRILLVHSKLFEDIPIFINEIILTFTIPLKNREILFKDILFYSYVTWRDVWTDLAKKVDTLETPSDLKDLHISYFNYGMQKIREFYRNTEVIDRLNLTHDDCVVLTLVLEKYYANQWNQDRCTYITNSITKICESDAYPEGDIYFRTLAIFEIYGMTLQNMLEDAYNVCKYLNGDLKGKVYRGNILE